MSGSDLLVSVGMHPWICTSLLRHNSNNFGTRAYSVIFCLHYILLCAKGKITLKQATLQFNVMRSSPHFLHIHWVKTRFQKSACPVLLYVPSQ